MNNEENKGTMNHKNFDTDFFKPGLSYRLKVGDDLYYNAILLQSCELELQFAVFVKSTPFIDRALERLVLRYTPTFISKVVRCVDSTEPIYIHLKCFEATLLENSDKSISYEITGIVKY